MGFCRVPPCGMRSCRAAKPRGNLSPKTRKFYLVGNSEPGTTLLSPNPPRKPPRRRAGTRHAPQKSFLCFSRFARDRFFLPRLRRGFDGQVKGKENFFVLLCSDEQGGGDGLCLSLGRAEFLPPHPV